MLNYKPELSVTKMELYQEKLNKREGKVKLETHV